MTSRARSIVHILVVIPNQVLNLIQDLRFRDLVFWLMNLGLKAPPLYSMLYENTGCRAEEERVSPPLSSDDLPQTYSSSSSLAELDDQ
jgi:hypothetical protein